MSEVKRYFTQLWKIESSEQRYAHGALGAVEIVRASDFDRVTAERDAALGREAALREDLEKQISRTNDFSSKLTGAQQRLTAADERAGVLEGLLWEYVDRDEVTNEWARDWLLAVTAALKPAEGGGDES